MSNIRTGDIDIDCANREDVLAYIKHIPAKKKDGTKHVTGVYVQDIPFDPLTLLAEENYEESKRTKLDFLNLSFLSRFSSNEEIYELLELEPDWEMLQDPRVVRELPQIHSHFDLVFNMQPKSINDLVDILHKIREHSEYKFKQSHAVAYALNIVVMLNYYRKHNIKFDENSRILNSEIFQTL